jgi:hypothetical protein
MATGKHVIFLGAGASKNSGYPLANDLRLLISSRNKWHEALLNYEKETKHHLVASKGLAYWERHVKALNLFRNGGFATLDEFCKLAGNQFQSEIHGLRRLVRAALGLFNPEDHFEKSEYYAFVQALFEGDLESLRSDVTVLTYNYDPYLEFLLHRALDYRLMIRQSGTGTSITLNQVEAARSRHHDKMLSAATSGFDDPGNVAWLNDDKAGPCFCVLKLHGSICFLKDNIAGYDTLFSKNPNERAESLFGELADSNTPPVLFPWEMMTAQGFVRRDSLLFNGFGKILGTLFQGIWERARREVQAADKISFVGLSMHSFLTDGLKYLFEGKKNGVEVCLANPENQAFVTGNPKSHWASQPSSPAYKLKATLKQASSMPMYGYTEPPRKEAGGITLVKDFSEFIRTQMEPIPLTDSASPA